MLRRSVLPLLALPLAACVGQAYQPVAVPVQRFELASDVLFDFGSPVLRPGGYQALAGILSQIRGVIPYPALRVVGHTDSVGGPAANMTLSLQRAESVRQWLIQAGGIPPQYITIEGRGEDQPVAPNRFPNGADNPQGRAANRRVELFASPA